MRNDTVKGKCKDWWLAPIEEIISLSHPPTSWTRIIQHMGVNKNHLTQELEVVSYMYNLKMTNANQNNVGQFINWDFDNVCINTNIVKISIEIDNWHYWGVRIQTLPGMARPNHPQTPNPSILTDLTTKARKCDSQHLITKVRKCPFLRVSDHVWGNCYLILF